MKLFKRILRKLCGLPEEELPSVDLSKSGVIALDGPLGEKLMITIDTGSSDETVYQLWEGNNRTIRLRYQTNVRSAFYARLDSLGVEYAQKN